MTSYEFECLTCGAVHPLTAAEVEAGGGPERLANWHATLGQHGRECPDCALHGGPRFPLWRWRRRELPPLTAAGKLALRGLMVRLRARGSDGD